MLGLQHENSFLRQQRLNSAVSLRLCSSCSFKQLPPGLMFCIVSRGNQRSCRAHLTMELKASSARSEELYGELEASHRKIEEADARIEGLLCRRSGFFASNAIGWHCLSLLAGVRELGRRALLFAPQNKGAGHLAFSSASVSQYRTRWTGFSTAIALACCHTHCRSRVHWVSFSSRGLVGQPEAAPFFLSPALSPKNGPYSTISLVTYNSARLVASILREPAVQDYPLDRINLRIRRQWSNRCDGC